jgi:MYXO-CTERM domain-containing protein
MRSTTVLFLVLLAPAPVVAQQLVTFDQVVTITERGNGAGAFHYLIKPAASEPASWTTPVDYSKGTAHVHLEVMSKPSKRNTAITICFDGNLEGYGCIATGTYTDVGTHDSVRVLPSATWQYNEIAWNRRRQEYHLVVKDPALGGTPGGRPASDYVPTTMRIVMTIVPPGGTYTPPRGVAAPAADAGAPPPAPDAAADSAVVVPPPVNTNPSPPDAGVPDTAVPAPTPSGESPTGAPPPAPPPPSTAPAMPVGSSPVSGGCSVGGSAAGGVLLLPAALLLALLRRRRRRRK